MWKIRFTFVRCFIFCVAFNLFVEMFFSLGCWFSELVYASGTLALLDCFESFFFIFGCWVKLCKLLVDFAI